MENKIKNKRGLSTVISVIILILLTLAVVSSVWVIVNNILNEKIDKSKACDLNFDKLTLNSEYTCQKKDNFGKNELQISINRGDIDLDEIKIFISNETDSSSFDLSDPSNEKLFFWLILGGDADWSNPHPLLEKESGETYIYSQSVAFGFPKTISGGTFQSIHIAPIIDEQECDISSSIKSIRQC